MNRYIVIAIILTCAFLEGTGQPNISAWSKKMDDYQSVWPETKLHLVLNQNKYSPGDTVWFKAYFLSESLVGIEGKQIMYLDLVDFRGRSKVHVICSVTNGVGHNQFVIPDTVSSGIYLVTAYSNWMRNFGPEHFFRNEIQIVLKNSLVPDRKTIPKVVVEGGHLIRDVTNKISVLANRPSSTIQLVDATGQEVSNVVTDVNGMASMLFIPKRNVSYFVRIAGESNQYALPPTEDDGFSVLISPPKNSTDPVKLSLTSPNESVLRGEELAVIVSSKSRIYYSTTFDQRTNDVVELLIPQDKLGEGVMHFSLLNQSGNLLASRDFYRSGSVYGATVEVAKHNFQPREKVRLDISIKDSNGQAVKGEFSVSVVNAQLFDTTKENLFSDELNLIAGLRQTFSIDRSDPNWMAGVDNFLIASTETIPWRRILSSEVVKPRFSFTSVIQKSGTAYQGDTLSPVPDGTQIIFYLQNEQTRNGVITSRKGKFVLTLFDVFGNDELFYMAQANAKDIPDLIIKWDADRVELRGSPASTESAHQDAYALFANKRKIIDKSFGFQNSTEEIASNIGNDLGENNFEEEIRGADVTVNVQDYLTFPTMEEFIREVIPAMYHRKKGDGDIVRVKYLETTLEPGQPIFIPGDPLYIIDGIATRNTDFFLSLKPSDLLSIKVVNNAKKLVRFGIMGKNGIVIVQTKAGNTREPLDDQSKLITGMNIPLDFKAREYGTERDKHWPDFRSTIYWNPTVVTDSAGKATLEFFCSDDVGKLRILIKGLTSEGRAFSTEDHIEVGPAKK